MKMKENWNRGIRQCPFITEQKLIHTAAPLYASETAIIKRALSGALTQFNPKFRATKSTGSVDGDTWQSPKIFSVNEKKVNQTEKL